MPTFKQLKYTKKMIRRRPHRQPTVEKFERNPLADFKPGVFIPTFRLYGLDKASEEGTVTYNETEYIEKKKETRIGCEVRLSECSIKAVNIKHQGERRLQQELDDISRRQHAKIKETEIQKQRLQNENTMKVKRTTVPLRSLKIPAWRYAENACKCVIGDGSYCPVHWKTVDNRTVNHPTVVRQHSSPRNRTIKKQRSFVVDTISDSDDDDFGYYARKNTVSQFNGLSEQSLSHRAQSSTGTLGYSKDVQTSMGSSSNKARSTRRISFRK